MVQSVSFGAGFFQPRGFDRRVDGDTLVANLTQPDVLPGVSGSLSFDIGEFRGMPLFGEWNLGINKHIEFSAGLSYFTNKVDSVYLDLVNGQQNNSEIEQELRLTMIPISGLVRFFPNGDPTGIQPYVGGGIAIIPFRYTETGDFVDVNTPGLDIYNAKYTAKGTAFGPVILGGVRFPLGVASAGLAILAFLPEADVEAYLERHPELPERFGRPHAPRPLRARIADTRDRGYAVNPGLIVKGSWGLGAAVFNRSGQPEWALSLTGVEFRFGPDRLPALGRTLLAHAHQLTTRIAAAGR